MSEYKLKGRLSSSTTLYNISLSNLKNSTWSIPQIQITKEEIPKNLEYYLNEIYRGNISSDNIPIQYRFTIYKYFKDNL